MVPRGSGLLRFRLNTRAIATRATAPKAEPMTMPTFAPVVSSGADVALSESESDADEPDVAATAAPPVVLEGDVVATASPDEFDDSVAEASAADDCAKISVSKISHHRDRPAGYSYRDCR